MKPKKRVKKPDAKLNLIEDNAETQKGKGSILEMTTSSISKQIRRSKMHMTGRDSHSKIGLDDSLLLPQKKN